MTDYIRKFSNSIFQNYKNCMAVIGFSTIFYDQSFFKDRLQFSGPPAFLKLTLKGPVIGILL